jgi:hypothetical protein
VCNLYNYYTKSERFPFFSDFWIISVSTCHADTCFLVLFYCSVCSSGLVLRFLSMLTLTGFLVVDCPGMLPGWS